MTKDLGRIQSIVSEKRVKMHIFEPSGRKIWTVVGVGEEHWIDPDNHYCSCPGFYFGQLLRKTTCYHLESAELARKENLVEKIIFSDEKKIRRYWFG